MKKKVHVTSIEIAAPASPPHDGGPDDWRAAGDAETLMRAEEIRGDKARHKAAKEHLKRKHKEVGRALGKDEPDEGPGLMGEGFRRLG